MVIIETFQRGASLSASCIRNQDRYIMIEVNSRRHPSAAPLYRCLLTSNDQARLREARNSRPVVRSLLRDAGSAVADSAHRPVDCFPERINAPRQQAASVRIPIASDAQASSHLPRFPPLEVCVRGPHVSAAPPSWGRHPQTFTTAVIRASNVKERL